MSEERDLAIALANEVSELRRKLRHLGLRLAFDRLRADVGRAQSMLAICGDEADPEDLRLLAGWIPRLMRARERLAEMNPRARLYSPIGSELDVEHLAATGHLKEPGRPCPECGGGREPGADK